jgi:hypothetical protein
MNNETNKMGDVPYQRGIGSLMYAATSTRPDIAFPVAILSQFMQNPGQIHWKAVKDVICYLKSMADLTPMLGGSDKGLKAYADADWASQPHKHSMSGYTVLLHSSPVAWSARKQTIIALSTAKAEYIALTVVMHEILYFQALITELYEPIIPPIPIYCNNQGAIALTTNNKFHARNISTYDITMSNPWYGADYLTYSIVPQSIILPTYLPRHYQGCDSQSCKQVYD